MLVGVFFAWASHSNERSLIKIKVENEESIQDLVILHCKFTQWDKTTEKSYIVTDKQAKYHHPEITELDTSEGVALNKAIVAWNNGKLKRKEVRMIKSKLSPPNYRKSA